MINKNEVIIIFNKLKLKIKGYLGIAKLEEELKMTQRELREYKTVNKAAIERLFNDINYNAQAINSLHRAIENVVHIGTDVQENRSGHSWAVVCIEGKLNIVKFVDLDRKDAREILDFLKHFEGSRHCIDAPYKEMFYDGLFKFQ